MKFHIRDTVTCSIKSGNGNARLSIIENWGNQSDVRLQTPLCMIYTKHGMIPHLIPDAVRITNLFTGAQGSNSEPPIHCISLANFVDLWRSCKNSGNGFKRFVGLAENALTFVSVHDQAKPIQSGYNDTNNVSLWGRGGRTRMDLDLFFSLLRALRLTSGSGIQLMADTDTPLAVANKRLRKATERTLRFAEQISARWDAEVMKIEPVSAGSSPVKPMDSVHPAATLNSPAAKNIRSFHQSGDAAEEKTDTSAQTPEPPEKKLARNGSDGLIGPIGRVIDHESSTIGTKSSTKSHHNDSLTARSVSNSSSDEARIAFAGDRWATITGGHSEQERRRCVTQLASLAGSGDAASPDNIAGFVLEGFQQNESRDGSMALFLPLLWKTISYLPVGKPRYLPGSYNPAEVWDAVRAGVDILDSTYAYRLTEACELLSIGLTFPAEPKDFTTIPIKIQANAEAFHSPVRDCNCYTCTKYTLAYLHHLLNTEEMLGSILITVHNMHQYQGVFMKIRRFLETE